MGRENMKLMELGQDDAQWKTSVSAVPTFGFYNQKVMVQLIVFYEPPNSVHTDLLFKLRC
jgi:hypothetical protein